MRASERSQLMSVRWLVSKSEARGLAKILRRRDFKTDAVCMDLGSLVKVHSGS